jgi:tRNA dimethylallyltransferase
MSAPAPIPPVVCLFGPTAAGKTEAAITLADTGPFDIVSVDSAMVYRGLDIGTAKPDAETLARAPHQLVDIRDPEDAYSVGDFVTDATAAIRRSHDAGRVPLLVGGTMLYFRTLFDGLADLPRGDPGLRDEIERRASALGWPALHRELAAVDPDAARRIRPNDSQRIQRALEVYRLTGKPISALHRAAAPKAEFDYLRIALYPRDRAELHRRIALRLRQMLDAGFVDEVRRLLSRPGVTVELPSMRAVGYRQIAAYVLGEATLEDAGRDAATATRRLAKRQFTWMRSTPGVHRVDPLEVGYLDRILNLAHRFLAVSAET